MKQSLMVLVLGTLMGTAWAQQGPVLTEEHLNALDTDKDGVVTRAEYDAYMTEAFRNLDADKDGYLSPKEFGAVITVEQFAGMDANNDKRVSQQEFNAQVAHDYDTADKSRDGRLN